MDRLNLTLDAATSKALGEHAREHRRPRAAIARELIREALERRATVERRRQLARDYAAGRHDAEDALSDHEAAELELLGDDDE